MKFIYPAIFHKDPDGYWAEFPDLAGCHTSGNTVEETLDNATEALSGYLLSLIDRDIKITKPCDISKIKLEENCFTSLVETTLNATKKSVNKTLTIPSWLNDKALQKNINFSAVLQNALMHELEL